MRDTTQQLLVVAGATGYLGGHVVRAAKAAGYRVRALARDPGRLGALAPLCDEVFVGEATDPASIRGLFEGADLAFSSIGVRHVRRRPTIWEVDARANLNLVEEAERAGVRRFVFVSLLGAPGRRARVPAAEARERVVDRLREGAMSYAIVRPNGFFNDMLEYLSMARRGRVWLFGRGDSAFNPIHGADLADVCVECLAAEERQERDVGGPDVVTTREVGALAFEALGARPRFGHVPLWMLRLTAAVVSPFNVNLGALLKMLLALHEEDGWVAPAHGARHLARFFTDELASSSEPKRESSPRGPSRSASAP